MRSVETEGGLPSQRSPSVGQSVDSSPSGEGTKAPIPATPRLPRGDSRPTFRP